MYGMIRVKPRYTCGSPAFVDNALGNQVAREEQTHYGFYLEGAYGEDMRQYAIKTGLGGVAVERIHPKDVFSAKRGDACYRDVITKEVTIVRAKDRNL